MLSNLFKLSFITTLLLLTACKSNKGLVQEEDVWIPEFLDTMIVDGTDPFFQEQEEVYEEPSEPYRASATRTFDLIHTELDLKFDWAKEQVMGTAELTLKPYFKPKRYLELDAVGFDIKSVTQSSKEIKYQYNNEVLRIDLGRNYGKSEEIKVKIDYIATPGALPQGGSAAITSDKGLFFINPDGSDPNKPKQIWTQGETEHNSKWFPTIDKPNERCTQEISLTVDQKYSTLSNGLMTASVINPDGTRTDTWTMVQAHAPYLAMLAIGEFAWVEDKWKEVPLYYIVEEEYKPYAEEIFNHTPEMLSFFSDILDYEYPWSKYAQIITRDYVSGAMENTTAVIFGEFVQKTDRELIDNDNDLIVAHEMFHHWFGDLVTCESWSNLTLNEGFANYSEYLWYEHKYGRDRADLHRMNELSGYYNQAQREVHPLIHYRYADKEDMFDAHSYNKGGLVLHMLRSYLGDDLFFSSLNRYLTDNAYTAVEVDELRMAFEDTSGEDLNWFFDQWYLDEGHPIISYETEYDSIDKKVVLRLTQEGKQFKIPFDATVYTEEGKKSIYRVWLEPGMDSLVLMNVAEKPACLLLDGEDDILGLIEQSDLTAQEAYYIFKHSPNFSQRYSSLFAFMNEPDLYNQVVEQGINDPFYMIRSSIISTMRQDNLNIYRDKLVQLSTADPHSEVRAIAFKTLVDNYKEDYIELAENIIKTERAYPVIELALNYLSEVDPVAAQKMANSLKDDPSDAMTAGLANVYARSADPSHLPWFKAKVASTPTFSLFPVILAYSEYLSEQSADVITDALSGLTDIGLNDNDRFRRYMATYAINNLEEIIIKAVEEEGDTSLRPALIEVTDAIESIKINESDIELMNRYSDF